MICGRWGGGGGGGGCVCANGIFILYVRSRTCKIFPLGNSKSILVPVKILAYPNLFENSFLVFIPIFIETTL